MNELMEKFAAARFGKQAFLGQLFGTSIDPKKRSIRDKIEDMIREEMRKRRLAQEAIEYGKHRLTEAPKSGLGGWTVDIARSLIPGLSISAARAVDGLVKKAEEPSEGLGGRLFDVAHLGAAGAGAGLGYGMQRGLLGGASGAQRTFSELGQELTGPLAKALGKGDAAAGVKHLMGVDPTAVILAGQKPTVGTKALRYISPTYWLRRLGKKPATHGQARALITRELRGRGVAPAAIRKVLKDLPGMVSTSRASAIAKLTKDVAKRVPFKGKWGALLGALAVASPFAFARLWKTRRLRASGGTAGRAAVSKAKELLSGAEQLRAQREGLMQQLA